MHWKDVFVELVKIPRPSGKEEVVARWIVGFLREHGFDPQQDAVGNIGVNIPQTIGSTSSQRILFQAHMDMVSFGGNDCFPTELEIVDGWMQSKDQKTTLGADNGIGVALALALVTEPDVIHGPLSLLFTVDEERGLTGARGFDPSIVAADIDMVVNLDSEEGVECICNGSAGGATLNAELRIENIELNPSTGSGSVENEKDLICVEISLKGLLGGHSGVDIHKNRGNAILLLVDLIDRLPITGVVACTGGSARNAIPAYAACTVLINKSALLDLQSCIGEFLSTQQLQYPYLSIEAIQTDICEEYMVMDSWATYVDVFRSIPLGVIEALPDQSERVITSNNLGVVDFDAGSGKGSFVFLARSANNQKVTDLVKKISAQITQILPSSIISIDQYSGWQELVDSPAIEKVKQAVLACGHTPLIAPYHAGLEVADILKKFPDHVSGVSIGPLMYDVHSPKERVSMQSVEEVWKLLHSLLVHS